MSQEKREQVKVNLTRIKDFLKSPKYDGKKQALIDLLEHHTDAIIPQEFDDGAINLTKEILIYFVPQYLTFEGETPAQQMKLASRIIMDCMSHLLRTPAGPHEVDRLLDLEFDANSHRPTKTFKNIYRMFNQPNDLTELLNAVVWSDAEEKVPNKVSDILKNHPELLFQKGQITKKGIETQNKYRFEVKNKNLALQENVIYISAINNKVCYSLITPTGVKIKKKLTNIDSPIPIVITEELKTAILSDTIKAGYTPTLYEQTYYNVSPYQLILFSGDIYLLEKIKPFITEENRETARGQRDELADGGADLVKLGVIQAENQIKDMSELTYNELRWFIEKRGDGKPRQVIVEDDLLMDVAYSLMENKDGIVLYDDSYYYVRLNHQSKIVEKIELITFIANNEQEQEQLDKLAMSFASMNMNSGRRSNDQEHRLIETITRSTYNPTGIQLERKGIHYKRGEDYYQDCKAESIIIQALRNYIQLWKEAHALDDDPNSLDITVESAWKKADEAWLDLGKAQATDVADKLLLYCINNTPLSPVPDFKVELGISTQNLNRKFKCNIYNNDFIPDVEIYTGRDASIGLNFSLVKGDGACRGWGDVPRWGVVDQVSKDLMAFLRYDQISSECADEFKKSLDLPIGNHLRK